MFFFQRKQNLYLSTRQELFEESFQKFDKQLDKSIEASFIASLAIAKQKRPHSIGETLIKPVLLDIVALMCGNSAAEKVKTVPLSNDTIKRRIDSMASDCADQLIKILRVSKFAIQLDESTTIADKALLLVYVRFVHEGEVQEDLLFSSNLEATTKGEDIFAKVDEYFAKHELSYQNLVACCSDGAASMMGKNLGFNTRLKRVAPHCKIIHCILHRQALAARKLSPELNNVLSISIKIINQIKARALNSRLFQKLCDDNDESYKTLLLHTEVRWLSRGKALSRLYQLRNSVTEMLLKINSEHSVTFSTDKFQTALAYLVDVFDQYNCLNLKLQGRDANVITCKEAIDSFIKKLSLWSEKVNTGNLEMFQELFERCMNNPLSSSLKEVIHAHLQALTKEMELRFQDLADSNKYCFVLNPFTAKLDDVNGLQEKEELLDLQASMSKQRYFEKHGFKKFWIHEGELMAPRLTKVAFDKVILPFATSYQAEATFSAVVLIKTKHRNRLSLHNDLRLSVTTLKPDIKCLVQRLQAQGSH